MRKSLIVLVVLALGMAGGTVYLINTMLQAERTKPKVVKKRPTPKRKDTYVLVARSTLQPGSYLRPNNVRWQVWPKGRVSPAYISRVGRPSPQQRRRVRELEGAVVRLQIPSGQPITDEMYVLPGERGFLAAVLKPGMRAVSININAATGVSGLAQPGDRVDLIWVYTIAPKRGQGRRQATKVAETLLVGVRLLAINQILDQPHRVSTTRVKGKKRGGSARNRTRKIKVSTATVELTPKQAEMIAVALTKGRITLSLNSLARPTSKQAHLITAANTDQTLKTDTGDGNPQRGRTFTMDQHVSRLMSFVRQQEPKTQKVVVLRGSKTEDAGSVKKKNKVEKRPDDEEEEERAE